MHSQTQGVENPCKDRVALFSDCMSQYNGDMGEWDGTGSGWGLSCPAALDSGAQAGVWGQECGARSVVGVLAAREH